LLISVGVGVILARLSDMNLTGLAGMFGAAAVQQSVYVAYRCTLSYEDILRKSRVEFIWSLSSVLFPEIMAMFFLGKVFT
jgi:hypothetical protein